MQQQNEQQYPSKRKFSEIADDVNDQSLTKKIRSQSEIVNIDFFIQNILNLFKKISVPIINFNTRATNLEIANNKFFFEIGYNDLDIEDTFMGTFQNLKGNILLGITDYKPLFHSCRQEINSCLKNIQNIITEKYLDEKSLLLLNRLIEQFTDFNKKAKFQLECLEKYLEDLNSLLSALSYNTETDEQEKPYTTYGSKEILWDHFLRKLMDDCDKSQNEAMDLLAEDDTKVLILKLASIIDEDEVFENNIINSVVKGYIKKIQRIDIQSHLQRIETSIQGTNPYRLYFC